MRTVFTQPTDPPVALPQVSRRQALEILGLGSGVVAVAAAGGVTWRAVEGGVFSTGTGTACEASDQAGPAGDPKNLVCAAELAANAHNTQPWIFVLATGRIDVFADMSAPSVRWTHCYARCRSRSGARQVLSVPSGRQEALTMTEDEQ